MIGEPRTFGTLTLKNRYWILEAEPHVMMKVKRLFGKVNKRSFGKIMLSDNLENARDLDWLVQRYPLIVTPEDALQTRADRHREKTEDIFKLLNGEYTPEDFPLKEPQRDYQRVATSLWLKVGGLLIGDDVGLGKSLMAIGGFTDKRTLPALVVTLAGIMPIQWQRMIQRFAPELRTHILLKATPYDITALGHKRGGFGHPSLFQAKTFPDVLICNYAKLHGWGDQLAGVVKSVVFDEGQELRNNQSLKYAAAQHIASKANFRLALSATPIFNYGGEMFNVLNVLRPGALGDRDEFLREWCRDEKQKPIIVDTKAFATHCREHAMMIVRTRSEVGRELPSIQHITQYVPSDFAVLERGIGGAYELARIIVGQGEKFKGEKMEAAGKLDNLLRQWTGIAKAPFVADFVSLLAESGEPILLFGWHREVYNIWRTRLAHLRPVLYTGSESPTQKAESLRLIASGESKVLMMSLRAGAGLDGLQDYIRIGVFGELDWSPGVHVQNVGRYHRDGTKFEGHLAYYCVSDYGSDPIMADVLGIKSQQINGIMRPDSEGIVARAQIDPTHIRRLAESLLEQGKARRSGAIEDSTE